MRYLTADPLTADDIRMIAVYLQHWIGSRAWERIRRSRAFGTSLYVLRIAARRIHTRSDIDDWREDAVALGIDPF